MNGCFFRSYSIDLRISRDTGNLKEYFALEIELKNARILLCDDLSVSFYVLLSAPREEEKARAEDRTLVKRQTESI